MTNNAAPDRCCCSPLGSILTPCGSLAVVVVAHWLEGLKKLGVPCGPVNTVPEVFEDPQIRHREMEISIDHPLTGDSKMKMIGNPIRYSETPVTYRNSPPMLGQHNREILKDWLELEDNEIERLSRNEVL